MEPQLHRLNPNMVKLLYTGVYVIGIICSVYNCAQHIVRATDVLANQLNGSVIGRSRISGLIADTASPFSLKELMENPICSNEAKHQI